MRTWLVTGASGSFGTAFIRTALAFGWCDRIIGVSRNATMRYALEDAIDHDPRVAVVPGDVRVLSDLLAAAGESVIDVIVHAAAEKHIGTGQRHEAYVRAVNVGGAVNVLHLAAAVEARVLVALSTDKAVDPVNVYGQSKADAERILLGATGHLRATIVRYGNVACSAGSVIPLFLKQREQGRLTVTDLRATRFFMPLADPPFCDCQILQEPGRRRVTSAVALVKDAIDHGQAGEIFVPDIPSGTIKNLADELGPDCVIEETGLRDGEKLHEQLISDEELSRTFRREGGGYRILSGRLTSEWPIALTKPGWRYTSDAAPQPIHLGEGMPA